MPFLDLEEHITEVFHQEPWKEEWFDGASVIRRKGRGDIESVRIWKQRAKSRLYLRRRRQGVRLERALKYARQVMREVEQQCATLSSIRVLRRNP